MVQGRILLLVLAAFFIESERAFAWGKVGHEVVAIVAESQLGQDVRNKISEIKGTSTWSELSLFPDTIKRSAGWTQTGPYHYANIKDGQTYFESIKEMVPSDQDLGDIVRALAKAEDILTSSKSSLLQKKYALSFMIHFVGDIHQPLHTGRPTDRGGNDIQKIYFEVPSNLHSIWDSMIIAKKAPDTKKYLAKLRKPSVSEIALWQNSYILDWLKEDTDKRLEIYSNSGLSSASYQSLYEKVVEERILRAGYRLAGWLNSIFSGRPFQPTKSKALREELKKILGPKNADIIALEPETALHVESLHFLDERDNCRH